MRDLGSNRNLELPPGRIPCNSPEPQGRLAAVASSLGNRWDIAAAAAEGSRSLGSCSCLVDRQEGLLVGGTAAVACIPGYVGTMEPGGTLGRWPVRLPPGSGGVVPPAPRSPRSGRGRGPEFPSRPPRPGPCSGSRSRWRPDSRRRRCSSKRSSSRTGLSLRCGTCP